VNDGYGRLSEKNIFVRNRK